MLKNTPRIIARLDIKNSDLVKGVNLEGLRVLGKPEQYAEIYYEEGCDEIIVQDVVAHLLEKIINLETVKKISDKVFVPITAGGGVKSIKDIEKILDSGASKVSLNTHVLENPSFISEAANIFGSSTISVSIDSGKIDNEYFAFGLNGRKPSSKKVLNWAKEVEEKGAGEIILSSIDRDGTGEGYDIDIIKKVKQNCSIRVIGNSGAGKYDDVISLLKETDLEAISLSSLLHYTYINKIKKISKYEEEGNSAFLEKRSKKYKNFENFYIRNLKEKLIINNLVTRL